MPVLLTTVSDGSEIVVKGSTFDFNHTLTEDSTTWNLTGATVTCTIRRESDPDTVLDTTLEDQSVSFVVAASGTVTWTVSSTQSGLFISWVGNTIKTVPHLVQYKVVLAGETFFPTPARIFVRSSID